MELDQGITWRELETRLLRRPILAIARCLKRSSSTGVPELPSNLDGPTATLAPDPLHHSVISDLTDPAFPAIQRKVHQVSVAAKRRHAHTRARLPSASMLALTARKPDRVPMPGPPPPVPIAHGTTYRLSP